MEQTRPLSLASVRRQHGQQQNANTLRAPAAPAAQGEAPPPIDDLDHSDAEESSLAQAMHNIWSAVVRKRQAYTWLTPRASSGFVLVRDLHDEATMRLRSQLPAAPAVEHGPAAVPASRCVPLRGRSIKIPTLIIGVSISITITNISISISIAASYLSASSVGG